MKMRIREFADCTGVSVRTLHYYDEIGLLPPAAVDRFTGYRYYDEASLLRMQEILFYRELGFSLKSIKELISSPHYDKNRALAEQKRLLTLKKERLERLIAAVDGAMKGENVMKAFDNSEYERYKAEARERWGGTDAYKEYEEKTKRSSAAERDAFAGELDGILAAFAACMTAGNAPGSTEAQTLVKRLQEHISTHCYRCTDEILAGLGEMYVSDERFRTNIDRHAQGTAAFIREAIGTYVSRADGNG